MDWTRLVIGVLIFLPSHGQGNSTITGENGHEANVTEVPNQVTIKGNENFPLNLINHNELELCLNSINDSSSSEFQNTCYLIRREINSDDWTLVHIIDCSTPSSYATVEESSVVAINCMVGALGGIIALLMIMLAVNIISYLPSHGIINKILRNHMTSACEADTKDEQEERTPIAPRRPPSKIAEENFTKCGTYNRSKQDNDIEYEDYVQANAIQVWQLEELKKDKALSGQVIV